VTGFTGAGLDRADHLRQDPAALAAALGHPAARLLVLDGADPPAADRLAWGAMSLPAGSFPVLLGLQGGAPRFVAAGLLVAPGPPDWPRILSLPPAEMAIYAAARALVLWHARHRFCANCGQPTAPFRAGWGRCCPACAAEHFPRVDPVAIMLVEHTGPLGPRILLARQPRFPAGRYSVLAGFVEPGESVEEAVAREVMEEAGVAVTAVRYHSSQPWPFPANLMIACTAQAADDRLTLDRTELEDAFWADAAAVRAALAGAADAPFRAPPPHAIARDLLEWWVARQ
jgi:NAD+ diphosphatase